MSSLTEHLVWLLCSVLHCNMKLTTDSIRDCVVINLVLWTQILYDFFFQVLCKSTILLLTYLLVYLSIYLFLVI